MEIINGSPGYKKVTGPLGQLCKIDQIIVRILIVNINGRFAAHETNVRLAGDNGGSSFVGTETGDQGQINSFVLEITVFNCHILGSVEDRMGYFVECNRSQRSAGG